MYHVTISYGQPLDPRAFDEYYEREHLRLASRIPGLRRLLGGRCEPADGEEPAAYYLARLAFDDRAAAVAGLDSPEGRAAAADIVNFATGGAIFTYSNDESVLEISR